MPGNAITTTELDVMMGMFNPEDIPPNRLNRPPFNSGHLSRRESFDAIPERPTRVARGLPPGGDRYRPSQEPLYSNIRTEYDSYRPPSTRESISAPLHRKGPSGSYQKRGQTDFRGGASVSPKTFHRLPARHSHGFSFSSTQDRNIYPNDHSSYGGGSTPRDRDDDDYRSRSPVSRPSSRSSIASTVPSERPYTPSRSTLSLAPEQPSSARGNTESGDTSLDLSKSATDRASPSPTPPGLSSSLDTSQPTSNSEKGVERKDTPPFRAETNEDDITEEAEVKDLLSQSELIDRVVDAIS